MPTSRMLTNPSPAGRFRGRGRAAAVLAAAAVGLGATATLLPSGAGAVPPSGAKSTSNGASVSIDRTTVKAGGRIKVSGKNWKSKGSRVQSGAQVTIKLDDSTIIAILPLKKKRFSGYVTIPRQVKAGKHWLRFLAAEPSTSLKSRTFKVTK